MNYNHGRKSRIQENAPSAVAASYVFRYLLQGQTPPKTTLRHSGVCVRCGRTLTTPESIDTGYGPECAGIVGVEYRVRSQGQGTLDAGDLLKAILGGNALFTVVSDKTGTRFTFRVQAPKGPVPSKVRFVKVLAGSDNETGYSYLGTIFGVPLPAPEPAPAPAREIPSEPVCVIALAGEAETDESTEPVYGWTVE